jgi:hypothetical protein
MQRTVVPEILDSLPSTDPEAIRSRADLDWLNAFFGNPAWFRQQICQLQTPIACLLEWGAGNGTLLRSLASALNPSPLLFGTDLVAPPPGWNGKWSQGDLLSPTAPPLPLPASGSTVILANLFLHHFETANLTLLGAHLDDPRVSTLLITEPWRHSAFWLGAHALTRARQMGRVTRHDAPISVRAGFRRGELASALKLNPLNWMIEETTDLRGMIRLRAHRR